MTVGQFVSAAINNSTSRDGYYMDRHPAAVLPMLALFRWINRSKT
jgi:hypothetical protein